MPDRPAVPDVQRDGDPLRAVPVDEPAGECRIGEGGRADDGSSRSPVEGRLDRRLVAQPAGHLDLRQATGGHDPRDVRILPRAAAGGRVEVDHVEPACAVRGERPGDRLGVVGVGGLTGEIALLQANDAPTAQVDGGQELEGACHPPSQRVSVLARYNDSTLSSDDGRRRRHGDRLADAGCPGPVRRDPRPRLAR
jgi:hypothetical protein